MKKFFAAGLSYKTAPVALREKHAVAPADRIAVASHLMTRGDVSEAVLLWTCNRVEIYGVTEEPRQRVPHMIDCLANKRFSAESGIYCHEDADAIRHLFSVTSGMDSMVLGETEITGQVKDAYEAAHLAGQTGRVLNKIFQKAFETTKEIRTRTGIGKGATSVGSVTIQHAQKIFGDALAHQSVLVIGAGKMAEACVRHLVKKGVKSILVANRSPERAVELASQFNGIAVPFEQIVPAMAGADIVISSTGASHTILHRQDIESVMSVRPTRPLFLIDIAVPRDIDADVQQIPCVHLFDIDSLEMTVRSNVSHRQQDLDLCHAIIKERALSLRPYLDRVLGERCVEPGVGAGAGCRCAT